MKLELKHLAPYLPYGLKAINTHRGLIVDVLGLQKDLDVIHNHGKTPIIFMKPILRPLSDLSEYLMVLEHTEQWQDEWIEHFMDFDFKPYEANINACPQDLFESMLENHFDVFGLIPKNLAIDRNTLNKII